MTATRLTSPCPSCPRWCEDKDECAEYCQPRRDYLHRAYGDPWIDVAALYAKHQAELASMPVCRELDFSNPGPKSRHFTCPICGVEVITSHWAQRTCNQGDCPKAHERKADAVRKTLNRETAREQARKRRRRKRMQGAMI
jgi:hypothetical protein